ncbi:MAG: protein kinase [Myxococcaceae bacterium]|nr:protein kinase [Myxococcaceae bacterium]
MTTQVFGKYQLLKKLATGGMAEVWLARQSGIEGFQKLCVVKRILPHLADDPEFVQMFLNEAKIAARFSHPNIAQIYDLGEVNGSYFIAMEFVHGEDLGRVMRKAWSTGQWVARPLAIRIVAAACEGLYYAHTKTDDRGNPLKVVHRDISPQNILVSFDGSVKVVDFGIAKAADAQSMTRSGAIKGKFAYMSPEQAAGKPLDQRSDIFAIGLVLYELLTGVRPLKRDSELATLQAALECSIEPPSKVADVPEELDPIVMGALAKSADDRYRDARELQMALEEFLVSQRWVATSVQVAELMTTLFKDRLEEEARLGYPDPLGEELQSTSGPPGAASYDRGTGPGGRASTEAGNPAKEMKWDAPPATSQPRDLRGEGTRAASQRGLAKTYRSSESNRTVLPPPDVPAWEAPPAAEVPGPRRSAETRAADPVVARRTASNPALPTAPRRASSTRVPAATPGGAEEPRRTRSRPSNEALRRRTGEWISQDDDGERTELPPEVSGDNALIARGKSGQYSLKVGRRSSSGTEMPEAPLPSLRSRTRRDEDDAEEPLVKPRKKQRAAKIDEPIRERGPAGKIVTAVVVLLVLAGLGVLGFTFRDKLKPRPAGGAAAEIYVSVTTNVKADVSVVHAPEEGLGDQPVTLGSTPIKKAGGVHVGDKLLFTNKPLGLKYYYDLPFGQPGETRHIRQEFQTGYYKLHFEPREATDLQLFLDDQQIGTYPGPKLELVEGKHTLTVKGPQLKRPANIEIEVQPGRTVEGKVFNLSSLML